MKEKNIKIILLSLIFAIIFSFYSFANEDILNITGEAGLVADEDFGAILYGKNIHEKLFPASTTKIMTAILILENSNLSDVVKIDEEVIANTKGSHIALDFDEELTVKDLVYGLLIASANDASVALAKHQAGSIDGFVELMNNKAKEIGANNTHFMNPHGLHDENHYTTAYDLLLIAQYAMSNEQFREIVSMPRYIIPQTNKKEERYILNTNKFLIKTGKMNVNGELLPISYEGISGVKTGFTDDAGNCLVSYANKNGKGMYTVVLKSNNSEVYSDTYKLMNYGYNNFSVKNIATKNEFIENIPLEKSSIPFIPAVLDKDVYYPIENGSTPDIKRVVKLNENLKLPIKTGDVLGSVDFVVNEKAIGESYIISTIDAEPTYKNIFDFLLSKWYLFVIALFIILKIFEIKYKLDRRNRRKSKAINH